MQIVVGIADSIVVGAVADLQVMHVGIRVVHKLMAVTIAGREGGELARRQYLLSAVGNQSRTTGDDVDELILLGVVMTYRRG